MYIVYVCVCILSTRYDSGQLLENDNSAQKREKEQEKRDGRREVDMKEGIEKLLEEVRG